MTKFLAFTILAAFVLMSMVIPTTAKIIAPIYEPIEVTSLGDARWDHCGCSEMSEYSEVGITDDDGKPVGEAWVVVTYPEGNLCVVVEENTGGGWVEIFNDVLCYGTHSIGTSLSCETSYRLKFGKYTNPKCPAATVSLHYNKSLRLSCPQPN